MLKQTKRKDKEISQERALQVFHDCTYAMLSTINEDGTPYCVPVSPAIDGKTVYIHGHIIGQKLENLQKNPRVCLSAVSKAEVLQKEFNTLFESVIAEGTAELVADEAVQKKGLFLICEKYSPDYCHLFEETISKSLNHTAVIKITLDQVTGKSAYPTK